MKKHIATVTESDIRFEIEAAVSELEQDGQIAFPDGNARNGFIEDCVLSQIDGVELYDSDPFRSEKDYTIDVLDMAALYGYTL
jgi:hypothetical protein